MSYQGTNLYEVLGVEPGATAEEIKRAYRRQVKRHHPDLDDAPDAHEKTRLINEAYALLGDAFERLAYDRAHGFARRTSSAPKSSSRVVVEWDGTVSDRSAGYEDEEGDGEERERDEYWDKDWDEDLDGEWADEPEDVAGDEPLQPAATRLGTPRRTSNPARSRLETDEFWQGVVFSVVIGFVILFNVARVVAILSK